MSELLSDARAQIVIELGNRSDVNSTINDQINFAVQELATMYEFPELRKTATCTTYAGEVYPLPTDYYGMIGVYDATNDMEIEYQEKWEIEKIKGTRTGSTGPRHYAIFNRLLYLWNPIPDGTDTTIRIDYWAKHPWLNNDSDAIIFPNEWIRGTRLKASAFSHRVLDMDQRADARQSEFDRWVNRIKLPRAKERNSARNSRAGFGRPRHMSGRYRR